MKLRTNKTRSMTVAIDEVQVEDLDDSANYSDVMVPGLTLRAQLSLIVHNGYLKGIPSIGDIFQEAAVRCNLREFISQPMSDSALTHVVGHVLRTHKAQYGPGAIPAFPRGGTGVELLLTAEGIPLLIPYTFEGRVDVKLPEEGQILHVCGVMECLPSFSTYRIFSPVTARVRETWRCKDKMKGKWEIWGLARLELDPRIKRPKVDVCNVHG